MSKAIKTVFGGTDDSAQKGQIRQNKRATELADQKAREARSDVMNLFPAADVNRNLSNFAAQETIASNLPQIINAIRGLPVDLSGLAPRDISQGFTTSTQALSQPSTPLSKTDALRLRIGGI